MISMEPATRRTSLKEIAMNTLSPMQAADTSKPIRLPFPQAMLDLDPRAAPLRLKRHQHLQFPDLQGWTIRAVGGSLWVTQDGDRRDVILESGESFRVERSTPVVIGALDDADIGLCRAASVHRKPSASILQRLLAPWPQMSALFASLA
jgi:hypothetical protein